MRTSAALITRCFVLVVVGVVAAHAVEYYKFDGCWGSYGTGAAQFYHPVGICLDADGKVYVVEYYNHRVQRFDAVMGYLSHWGSLGSSDGQFSYPWGIAVSSESMLYVGDTLGSANNRIQVFQLTGSFVSKFGGYGSATGKFDTPRALAMDESDNLYVADSGNSRVQKLDHVGGFIATWGTQGSGDTNLYYPNGIAYGAGGFVFVADTYNHRIVKYTSSGTFVTKWGSYGAGDGQFSYPAGVAVGKDNAVYVADTSNHRLQKFDADGNWKDTWGQYGTGEGDMYSPTGIHVDANLRVWITEHGNHRVQRFHRNKVPTAPTKLTVKPLPAYDDTDLTANASGATDADGDALSYRYQWWKSEDGGTTFSKGPAAKVLKNSETIVGEIWKVQAWAYDGIARSLRIYSAEVPIVHPNTKPTTPTSVVITPKNPTDDDELKATATGATDADGDTLVYRYQWQKSNDGTTWTNGPAKRFLPASETSVGEWWRCQARAYDGTAVGPIKTSAKVQIRTGSASALALTATAQGGDVSQVVVSLSAAANVRATITNLAGIVVAELPARDLAAGISTLSWNGVGTSGSKVPGGVYLVRVTAATADGSQTSVLAPLWR
ncbi:MAG: hypothetical protein HPY69_21110 [Armatimonadetes bacterium]|nr:hypothetical protein [Armatimonadota bacterium]